MRIIEEMKGGKSKKRKRGKEGKNGRMRGKTFVRELQKVMRVA